MPESEDVGGRVKPGQGGLRCSKANTVRGGPRAEIHAAIVGLGRWGQTLVASVQGKSDRLRFTAAVSRDPARVSEFTARHRLRILGSLDAALADPGIDAVVLATPHSLHADQIVAVAAAGKIHTDLAKGFIRAEVTAYDDLHQAGSVKEAKAKHLQRLEGKDYIVKDGDVVYFRSAV